MNLLKSERQAHAIEYTSTRRCEGPTEFLCNLRFNKSARADIIAVAGNLSKVSRMCFHPFFLKYLLYCAIYSQHWLIYIRLRPAADSGPVLLKGFRLSSVWESYAKRLLQAARSRASGRSQGSSWLPPPALASSGLSWVTQVHKELLTFSCSSLSLPDQQGTVWASD